jgi:hypothetical protein
MTLRCLYAAMTAVVLTAAMPREGRAQVYPVSWIPAQEMQIFPVPRTPLQEVPGSPQTQTPLEPWRILPGSALVARQVSAPPAPPAPPEPPAPIEVPPPPPPPPISPQSPIPEQLPAPTQQPPTQPPGPLQPQPQPPAPTVPPLPPVPPPIPFSDLQATSGNPSGDLAPAVGSTCPTAAEPAGCCWQFDAGAEATLLFPVHQSTVASAAISSWPTQFGVAAVESLHYGPRVWIGASRCDWGIRARYWQQSDAGDRLDPLVGPPDTSGFISDQAFQAYTVDFEVTRRWCFDDGCRLMLAAGFRYASFQDLAFVHVSGTDGAPIAAVADASALAITEFDAPGFEINLSGVRPIQRFDCSTLSCFWSLQGSYHSGDIVNTAQTTVNAYDPGLGSADRVDLAAARSSTQLLIGDIQLGLQWEGRLRCSPAVPFARIAFEYQYWTAQSGSAVVASLAQVNNTGGIATAAAGPDLEMSLIGMTLGAGITW